MLCLTVVYCHLLLALPVAPDSAADTLNSPVNATSVGITYRDIARPENTLSNRANSTKESTHSLPLQYLMSNGLIFGSVASPTPWTSP